MSYGSSLEEAVRAILVSFDSTIRSNLSVGFPIDLAVYLNDSFALPEGIRIDDNDPYMHNIRRQWSEGLKNTLQSLNEPPEYYFK